MSVGKIRESDWMNIDTEEYKRYKFLFFLNLSPIVSFLNVNDRKSLAQAIFEFEPQSELLRFVKKELLWKLTNIELTNAGEMIEPMLSAMDMANGGKITDAAAAYFKAVAPQIIDPGAVKMLNVFLGLDAVPKVVKKKIG